MLASCPSVFPISIAGFLGHTFSAFCHSIHAAFTLLCLVVICERWAASILSSLVVLMLGERYGFSRGDSSGLRGSTARPATF